jgi:uncharacterized membrane protein
MMRLIVLLLFLSATASLAQDYPTLFSVSGVAANDVLNIRAEPSSAAEIIGTLAPDATGVEVISVTGDWAIVNTAERSGYVALRFLTRDDGPAWNSLSVPLACFGTEPFWSLDIDPESATATLLSSDDVNGQAMAITRLWPGTPWAPAAALSSAEVITVLNPAECSDGMSERMYGISIDIFPTDPNLPRLSGCCSLALR